MGRTVVQPILRFLPRHGTHFHASQRVDYLRPVGVVHDDVVVRALELNAHAVLLLDIAEQRAHAAVDLAIGRKVILLQAALLYMEYPE